MRKNGSHLDRYRKIHPTIGASDPGSLYGFFVVPCAVGSQDLRIISSGEHRTKGGKLATWEHVSVSVHNRCPTWDEMCIVKDLFWDDTECVVQLHPPKSDYINAMPYCLHLWKPKRAVELPPSIALAPKIPDEEKKRMKTATFAKTLVRWIRSEMLRHRG